MSERKLRCATCKEILVVAPVGGGVRKEVYCKCCPVRTRQTQTAFRKTWRNCLAELFGGRGRGQANAKPNNKGLLSGGGDIENAKV